MITITDKSLLHKVIDTLPPEELNMLFKLFNGFIVDYLDSQITDEEYAEHRAAIDSGEYVSLEDLPD